MPNDGEPDLDSLEVRDDAESVASLLKMPHGSYGFHFNERGVFVPLSDGVDTWLTPLHSCLAGGELCISGSRGYSDWELVRLFVKSIPQDVALTLGGAPGVDREAELAAEEFHLNKTIMPADWSKFGKSAGMIRNIQMVDAATDVVAFWDMKSPGTKQCIQYAQSQGKLRFVIPPSALWQEYNLQKDTEQAKEKWGTPPLMSVARDLENA